ncbi:MAG: hypothetical protein L0K46_07930, partial [Yaniella sp.]|nr:hypothetical protein [Yaniella sp.]
MELSSLLPNVCAPVPTDILNLDKLSDASLGEMVHAGTQLLNLIVTTMNDPTTYDTIPTFITQPGGDWNGYQPQTKPALNDQAASPEMPAKSGSDLDGVVAPENFYDTLQALGLMFGRLEHLTEAANTLYASYVTASMSEQQRYFG